MKRREFLKVASTAGAGTLVAGQNAWGESATESGWILEIKMALWNGAFMDSSFRAQLLADPALTAASLPQISSPPKPIPPVNWVVLEDSPTQTYVIVPPLNDAEAWEGLTGTNLGAALADPAFRAELAADAKSAIEAEFGIVLPANMNVTAKFETFYERVITLQDDLSALYDPSMDPALTVYHASGWCGRTLACAPGKPAISRYSCPGRGTATRARGVARSRRSSRRPFRPPSRSDVVPTASPA